MDIMFEKVARPAWAEGTKSKLTRLNETHAVNIFVCSGGPVKTVF